MKTIHPFGLLAAIAATAFSLAPAPAAAAGTESDARIEELERRQEILTEELRKVREDLVVPEVPELKSSYGLGPAASKVYGLPRGLSIGGYGEFHLVSAVSDDDGRDDVLDYLRFVLYTGYKYSDWIVLNAEIEIEHATTGSTVSAGSGSVSLEFAQLDFLLDPRANIRTGLMLVPVGFVNEIHEPPFFLGNRRPPLERQLIPSTWRSAGAGLFGEILPGVQYRTYVVTSLNAKGFGSTNLRGARQKGNRALAEDFSWVGRVDATPATGLTVGGSAYVGNQGQNRDFGGQSADAFFQLYEGHIEMKRGGFHARGLYAFADLDDAEILSADPDIDETIGERMTGWYVEAGYDLLPFVFPDTTQSFMPWVRYTDLDTNDSVPTGFAKNPAAARQFFEVGVAYKPIEQIVLKLDYLNADSDGNDLPDEVSLGAGFVF